jgi:hypothetical protein
MRQFPDASQPEEIPWTDGHLDADPTAVSVTR